MTIKPIGADKAVSENKFSESNLFLHKKYTIPANKIPKNADTKINLVKWMIKLKVGTLRDKINDAGKK